MYVSSVEDYRYHNLHFVDKKTEVWRGYLTSKWLSQDSKFTAQYVTAN